MYLCSTGSLLAVSILGLVDPAAPRPSTFETDPLPREGDDIAMAMGKDTDMGLRLRAADQQTGQPFSNFCMNNPVRIRTTPTYIT